MRKRGWPALAAAAIGVGLVLAPIAFQMFDRAPKGGEMIDGFAPYMTTDEIVGFRTDLDTIGAAHGEARALSPDQLGDGATARLVEAWPAIDDDMRSMLDTMEANIENYDGVAALPPFPLFPWFFVAPGVLVAAVALAVRRPAIGLAVLAIGLLVAPAAFQMFTRAPGGSAMIDDFRRFMTTAKVTEIQGYFLTIGGAEAELRHDVLATSPPGALPGIERLADEWPAISGGMAPMIGAMSDNVDNFAAVTAMPPFWLFPWFFVAPGVLLLGLAEAARRRAREPDATADAEPVSSILEGATT